MNLAAPLPDTTVSRAAALGLVPATVPGQREQVKGLWEFLHRYAWNPRFQQGAAQREGVVRLELALAAQVRGGGGRRLDLRECRDRIDTRSWKGGEPLASYPLTVDVPGGGAAVLFRYGVVVFFEVTEPEETAFLVAEREHVTGGRELRLIQHERAVRYYRRQRKLELDEHRLAETADAQIADIQQPRT